MKKTTLATAVMALVASINVYMSTEASTELTDLQMENIEALASTELINDCEPASPLVYCIRGSRFHATRYWGWINK